MVLSAVKTWSLTPLLNTENNNSFKWLKYNMTKQQIFVWYIEIVFNNAKWQVIDYFLGYYYIFKDQLHSRSFN